MLLRAPIAAGPGSGRLGPAPSSLMKKTLPDFTAVNLARAALIQAERELVASRDRLATARAQLDTPEADHVARLATEERERERLVMAAETVLMEAMTQARWETFTRARAEMLEALRRLVPPLRAAGRDIGRPWERLADLIADFEADFHHPPPHRPPSCTTARIFPA